MRNVEIKVEGIEKLRKLLGPGKVNRALARAANKAKPRIIRQFQRTTSTWRHKPTFAARSGLSSGGLTLDIGTNDRIYGYVSNGTPAHVIRPRRAPLLRFQSGYRAKTRPNSLSSGAGGKYGPYVVAKEVNHPGTKARKFDAAVLREEKPRITQDISVEIAKEFNS
jgi:hypothetical protein